MLKVESGRGDDVEGGGIPDHVIEDDVYGTRSLPCAAGHSAHHQPAQSQQRARALAAQAAAVESLPREDNGQM